MRTCFKLGLASVLAFVVCLLPTVQAFAATERNWNIYCITSGDCALYDPSACVPGAADNDAAGQITPGEEVPDSELPGATVKAKIWNYLIAQGFTPVQAAGIYGNIGVEGVYDPQSVENQPGLVARSKDPYDAGSYGWGLFGFTPGYYVFGKDGSWFQASNDKGNVHPTKANVYYISTQMDVMYAFMKFNNDLGSAKSLLDTYKARATSVSEAALAFEDLFENPADPGASASERISNAQQGMNKFGHGGSADQSAVASVDSNPGDIQNLANKVLANVNITFSGGGDSPVANQLKKLAQGDDLQNQDGRTINVQPIVLAALLHLADGHRVRVDSLVSAGQQSHSVGKAMDIGAFDGDPTNGSDVTAYKIISSLAQVLPSGSHFGMGNDPFNGTKVMDDKEFTAFKDSPNFLHFDVTGIDQATLDRAVELEVGGSNSGNDGQSGGQACCPTSSSSSDSASTDTKNDPVKKFLQALAYQENGGAVIGTSSTGAQGKFQYIDSTWQSHTASYYPPASKYSSANDAPEAYQDAVAYLEYVTKYRDYKGDFRKMAISHFYPAALDDPSLLDQTPPGNVITPREYGDSVLKHMKNGDGDKITFKYDQAPQFDKYLQKAGGSPSADSSNSLNDGSDGAGGGSGSCKCAPGGATADGNVIVIDPGHGPSRTVKDPQTGLSMVESPGGTGDEIGHVWNTATILKDSLEKDGYKVLMTKKSENEDLPLAFRDRANVADQNHATLALSIHGDTTLPDEGQIYVQKDGLYRGSGSNKTTFNDSQVAQKSQAYAKIFQEERQKIGGGTVVIKDNSFDGRGGGMEPGNIPMVQLMSKTPWVYNEKKLPFDDKEYAKELEASVKKAVPLSGAADPAGGGGGGGGAADAAAVAATANCASTGSADSAVQLAMQYAWPDGSHGAAQKPEYRQAIIASKLKGWYIGGGFTPGNDCGGFVTTVMRNSADPNYNDAGGPTATQEQYMKSHPEKYQSLGTMNDASQLRPGDIAVTAEHTFMYTGKQPNWDGNIASASLPDRAPNSGTVEFSDINGTPYKWYRLIGG